MIVVHHLNESRSQRVLWLLEELGVPYDIAFYRRDAHNLAPPQLKNIHPLGKSPVITDGDRAIAESGAIIDYIVRRHGEGRLQPDPADPAYDDYVQWLHYAEGSAVLPLVMKGIAERAGKWLAPLSRHADGEIALHLAYVDQRLADRPFLLGHSLTRGRRADELRRRTGRRQRRPARLSEPRRLGPPLPGAAGLPGRARPRRPLQAGPVRISGLNRWASSGSHDE
jgi:glutathione S-transferase